MAGANLTLGQAMDQLGRIQAHREKLAQFVDRVTEQSSELLRRFQTDPRPLPAATWSKRVDDAERWTSKRWNALLDDHDMFAIQLFSLLSGMGRRPSFSRAAATARQLQFELQEQLHNGHNAMQAMMDLSSMLRSAIGNAAQVPGRHAGTRGGADRSAVSNRGKSTRDSKESRRDVVQQGAAALRRAQALNRAMLARHGEVETLQRLDAMQSAAARRPDDSQISSGEDADDSEDGLLEEFEDSSDSAAAASDDDENIDTYGRMRGSRNQGSARRGEASTDEAGWYIMNDAAWFDPVASSSSAPGKAMPDEYIRASIPARSLVQRYAMQRPEPSRYAVRRSLSEEMSLFRALYMDPSNHDGMHVPEGLRESNLSLRPDLQATDKMLEHASRMRYQLAQLGTRAE